MGNAKRLFTIVLSLLILTGASFGRTKQVKKQSTGAVKQVSSKSPKSKPSKSIHNQANSKSSKPASKNSASSRNRKGSRRKTASSSTGKHHTAPVARGQQGITSERTLEIQNALIREHYLDGEANGVWDQRTKDALVKYQLSNGWQTKIVPDSRALIKLGLGPSKDGLLNPESAAIGNAHEMGVEKEIPGGAVAH